MGKVFSKLFSGKKPLRILMIGLDSAGKSTILYQLKLGEYVQTIPTIGFNVETVKYKNVTFDCWDAGGQEKFQSLWHHYSKNAQAIIFVVDSSDVFRIEEAKEAFHNFINEIDLDDVYILIYANKQDLPDALPVNKIVKKLGIDKLENAKWHIEPTIATTGSGILDGLNWLVDNLTGQK